MNDTLSKTELPKELGCEPEKKQPLTKELYTLVVEIGEPKVICEDKDSMFMNIYNVELQRWVYDGEGMEVYDEYDWTEYPVYEPRITPYTLSPLQFFFGIKNFLMPDESDSFSWGGMYKLEDCVYYMVIKFSPAEGRERLIERLINSKYKLFVKGNPKSLDNEKDSYYFSDKFDPEGAWDSENNCWK